MKVRSLQIRTDLMLRGYDGTVADLGDHLAVRTPDNPTFRWGNYLVFDRPPGPEDVARWPAVFADVVGGPPAIDHVALTWDAPDGATGAAEGFVAAGYDRWELATMTLRRIAPAERAPTPCVMRDLVSDADWDAWRGLAEAQNAALPPGEREGPGHAAFVAQSAARNRAMIAAGWGRWFGAFVDGALAASMGLFVRDGLGRFQTVDTHPAFRRRGLATTLLRHAVAEGLGPMGAHTLVIVADVDDVAMGIYATAGFADTERITQLEFVPARGG